MKTLILLLISFSSFSQVDTIQPPCDLTRQQTRLWYKLRSEAYELEETKAKLYDDQHKRENDKEKKQLRIDSRNYKNQLSFERLAFKKSIQFQKDSLNAAHDLLMRQEKNRNSEVEKTLRNERKALSEENKLLRIDNRNKVNKNLVWIIVGIAVFLILILLIIIFRKK